MGNYDLYRARLQANGSSEEQATINSTKQFVNDTFSGNPIDIDGVIYDAKISNGELGKDLLFKPNTVINIGSIATIDNQKYLINEFIPNEVYPKAKSLKCNNILQYNNTNIPCVITNELRGFQSFRDERTSGSKSDVGLLLPKDTILVLIPYNIENDKIKYADTFVFNGRTYEVSAYDNIALVDNGYGILQYFMTITTSESTTSGDSTTNQQNWW